MRKAHLITAAIAFVTIAAAYRVPATRQLLLGS